MSSPPSPSLSLVAASCLLSTLPSYLSTLLHTVLSPPHPLYSPFVLISSLYFPLASLLSLPVTFGTFAQQTTHAHDDTLPPHGQRQWHALHNISRTGWTGRSGRGDGAVIDVGCGWYVVLVPVIAVLLGGGEGGVEGVPYAVADGIDAPSSVVYLLLPKLVRHMLSHQRTPGYVSRPVGVPIAASPPSLFQVLETSTQTSRAWAPARGLGSSHPQTHTHTAQRAQQRLRLPPAPRSITCYSPRPPIHARQLRGRRARGSGALGAGREGAGGRDEEEWWAAEAEDRAPPARDAAAILGDRECEYGGRDEEEWWAAEAEDRASPARDAAAILGDRECEYGARFGDVRVVHGREVEHRGGD
ncbi:hypothetical protein C8R45DRAFT_946389 [Mycena sanguinolenta]|nr:hypothetical protein C8R45DRAFT_946389 [Mycena sanguinolenta]